MTGNGPTVKQMTELFVRKLQRKLFSVPAQLLHLHKIHQQTLQLCAEFGSHWAKAQHGHSDSQSEQSL